MPRPRKTFRLKGYDYDFRSGKERDFAEFLHIQRILFTYETLKVPYEHPATGMCHDCGSTNIVRNRNYYPDFICEDITTGQPVIFEYKGRFTPTDRTKMLLIKKSNPDLDIRIVFQTDNWLTAKHKHRYSDWCRQKGFVCYLQELPQECLKTLKQSLLI